MRKIGIIVAVLAVAVISALAAVMPASAASRSGPVLGEMAVVPQIQPQPGPPNLSYSAERVAPNPGAYEQCEKAKEPLWTPYFEDRFHVCYLVHSGFNVVIKKNGVNVVVGNWTLLWIVTGQGSNGLASMTFRVQSRLWSVWGVPPNPLWRWAVGLSCLNYFGSACTNTHAAGYDYDVAEWSVPRSLSFVFNTYKSPGYTPPDEHHDARDVTNYHAMSQWQMFPDNPAGKSWSNPVYFRGDKASYVPDALGTLYYQVIPTWNISLSSNAKEVAQNIKNADKSPGILTYPPKPAGKDVIIPGFAWTDEPLIRMSPTYNPIIYQANRRVAKAACVAKWGVNYSQGGKYDCDEYPMAATFQGAATANGKPWWYTVKVVTESANGSASRLWNDFLKNNRVLAGDQFWVNIVS